MWNATNTLVRARNYFKPRRWRPRSVKIPVYGKKSKGRYYYGNSKEYREFYLHSEHWKQLRAQKLESSPVCEDCNEKHHVEPHHLVYKNLYDITLEDMRTLCRKCHNKTHNADWIEYMRGEKENIRKRECGRINRLILRTAKLGNIPKSVVRNFVKKHGW